MFMLFYAYSVCVHLSTSFRCQMRIYASVYYLASITQSFVQLVGIYGDGGHVLPMFFLAVFHRICCWFLILSNQIILNKAIINQIKVSNENSEKHFHLSRSNVVMRLCRYVRSYFLTTKKYAKIHVTY